jgi:hypothetical protein
MTPPFGGVIFVFKSWWLLALSPLNNLKSALSAPELQISVYLLNNLEQDYYPWAI